MLLSSNPDQSSDRRDLVACTALLRQGSRSFAMASRLLPADARLAATALYAFCRVADDLIDDVAATADGIAALRHRINAIYAGQPIAHASIRDGAADRAFAIVVRRYAIPRALVDAMVEGFAWDAEGRRYETFEDVLDYAARVAGSVGIMMSLIMGCRDPQALARAADLGTAMQLTNITRDVAEDARNGRLYLPRDWLISEGIDPEAWLASPSFSPALARVVSRLLAEAAKAYARAEAGIRLLPADCRPAIRAARLIYGEIGVALLQRQANPMAGRIIVSTGRKLVLAARAIAPLQGEKYAADAPALQANRFMIETVEASASLGEGLAPSITRQRRFKSRIAPVLSIIEKLERAERARSFTTGYRIS